MTESVSILVTVDAYILIHTAASGGYAKTSNAVS
jgi:hypothetical protein